MAYERAGRAFFQRGAVDVAVTYLARARRAYGRWGATAKVALLERAYPGLSGKDEVRPHPLLDTHTSSGSGPGGIATLDAPSMIKAMQVLSSERTVERLLGRMMEIVRRKRRGGAGRPLPGRRSPGGAPHHAARRDCEPARAPTSPPFRGPSMRSRTLRRRRSGGWCARAAHPARRRRLRGPLHAGPLREVAQEPVDARHAAPVAGGRAGRAVPGERPRERRLLRAARRPPRGPVRAARDPPSRPPVRTPSWSARSTSARAPSARPRPASWPWRKRPPRRRWPAASPTRCATRWPGRACSCAWPSAPGTCPTAASSRRRRAATCAMRSRTPRRRSPRTSGRRSAGASAP